MNEPTPPRRRWFRFSLRTLFVLVTLMGTFLGWLGVQLKWMRDREATFNHGSSFVGFEGNLAPWSIRLLGAPGFRDIYLLVDDVEHLTDAERANRKRAASLFPEAEVQCTTGPFVIMAGDTKGMHSGVGFF